MAQKMKKIGLVRPFILVALLACFEIGCGGGSSSTSMSGGDTPSPDFSIVAAPSSLSLLQGSSASMSFSYTSLNGFNGAVHLTLSGLPNGLLESPAYSFYSGCRRVQKFCSQYRLHRLPELTPSPLRRQALVSRIHWCCRQPSRQQEAYRRLRFLRLSLLRPVA